MEKYTEAERLLRQKINKLDKLVATKKQVNQEIASVKEEIKELKTISNKQLRLL